MKSLIASHLKSKKATASWQNRIHQLKKDPEALLNERVIVGDENTSEEMRNILKTIDPQILE